MKMLTKEFDAPINSGKKLLYRAAFSLEEKKSILHDWKEYMKLVKRNIYFFDFLENYHSRINVLTKTTWIKKEDNSKISAVNPPLESVIISHKGTELVASPFKLSTDSEIKKVVEQNNYTNQCLNILGKQLKHIETKIENPKSSKIEKPLVKLPEVKPTSTSLMSNNDKTIVRIEKMLKDLEKSQGKRPIENTEVVEDSESHNLKTISKIDVPTEEDSSDDISLIEAQFANLELNRIQQNFRSQFMNGT